MLDPSILGGPGWTDGRPEEAKCARAGVEGEESEDGNGGMMRMCFHLTPIVPNTNFITSSSSSSQQKRVNLRKSIKNLIIHVRNLGFNMKMKWVASRGQSRGGELGNKVGVNMKVNMKWGKGYWRGGRKGEVKKAKVKYNTNTTERKKIYDQHHEDQF
ncbi:hypothetical protein BJ165DRAFT_1407753 [Panaeolus papilionaceus]|nr:hypothetical protein BJ165DRAFT_1407753 [Panaeolus papilionaceus]